MFHQYMSQAQSKIAPLSSDELKELINDDVKLEEYVNQVLANLNEEKDVIITENRTLAEQNMNKEPEIVERKGRISELSEQGTTLCKTLQEKIAELKDKKGDQTPETALALLQASAAESEEKSDKIVTQLQEKELTIEEFVEQFMPERKLMHARKLKADKMSDLMRQPAVPPRPTSNFGPPQGGGFMPYPPSGFLQGGMLAGRTSVPYPTGPLAMPTPHNMFSPRYQ